MTTDQLSMEVIVGENDRSPLDKTTNQDAQNLETTERVDEQQKTTTERVDKQSTPGDEATREMPTK